MTNYIGLYYPSIEFKDDSWVKLAALYWDKLGRIVPSEYTPRDSDTVKQLIEELNFIENFEPSDNDKDSVAEMFLDMLSEHGEELARHYHATLKLKELDTPANVVLTDSPEDRSELDPKLAHIFCYSKMAGGLRWALVNSGLAIPLPSRLGNQWGMHPKLAFIYMEVLAEQMASTRYFHPLTDNVRDHLAVSGYTLERLTQALLGSGDQPSSFKAYFPKDSTPTIDEIERQVAIVALQSVIPRDIASVPTKKIVQLRNKHRNELTAFQTYLHNFVADLQQFPGNDLPALHAHLEVAYEKNLKPQLDDFKKYMKSLGIDTIMGALNVRVTLPPLFAGLASLGLDFRLPFLTPFIIGAGAIAFSVFPVLRKKQQEARQVVHSSPAAYLLNIQEGLGPANLASQVSQRARQMFFSV